MSNVLVRSQMAWEELIYGPAPKEDSWVLAHVRRYTLSGTPVCTHCQFEFDCPVQLISHKQVRKVSRWLAFLKRLCHREVEANFRYYHAKPSDRCPLWTDSVGKAMRESASLIRRASAPGIVLVQQALRLEALAGGKI